MMASLAITFWLALHQPTPPTAGILPGESVPEIVTTDPIPPKDSR